MDALLLTLPNTSLSTFQLFSLNFIENKCLSDVIWDVKRDKNEFGKRVMTQTIAGEHGWWVRMLWSISDDFVSHRTTVLGVSFGMAFLLLALILAICFAGHILVSGARTCRSKYEVAFFESELSVNEAGWLVWSV